MKGGGPPQQKEMRHKKRKWVPWSLIDMRRYEPKVYNHLQDIASEEGAAAFIDEWERIFGPMPEALRQRYTGESHVKPMPESAWEWNLNEAWAWVVRLFRKPMEVPPRPPASDIMTDRDKQQDKR
jgi:hypothetical protein